MISCDSSQRDSRSGNANSPSIEVSSFGRIPDAGEVKMYKLDNGRGMVVEIINYGAIIKSIQVPDDKGDIRDITLGFDRLEGYLTEHPYFGTVIGRYGNRIANGSFQIDGQQYSLATNNGPNHLHGGLNGFDKVLWDEVRQWKDQDSLHLELSYLSPDGEEGYPGNLQVILRYSLTSNNEIIINYKARTDQKTHVNLTNHSYFNLDDSPTIEDHELKIIASQFTPVDNTLIPTGVIDNVSGGPFDFTSLKRIGEHIGSNNQQIEIGGGYDHNFVLNKPSLESPSITVRSNLSRIAMDVYTLEPGVQFYTGNFLDGSIVGKSGGVYEKRSGFCLETQHFPDSPNHEDFPSTLLNPGEEYTTTTIYRFYNF